MSDSVSINQGVTVGGKAPPVRDEARFTKWWLLDATKHDGKEVADAILAAVKRLKEDQRDRIAQCVLAARRYGNAPLLAGGATKATLTPAAYANRMEAKDNVTQSIVDTSTATIGENKPRPYHLTDGGDYKLQRQAKKLNQYTDGMFAELKAYQVGSDAQRDAEIFGDGWVYVGQEFNRVVYQRALSTELWCDELEGSLDKPRQLHWERPVDRDRLIALFPEKAKQLLDVARADPTEFGGRDGISDMVVFRRSWHLRAGPEEVDQKGESICTGVWVASVDGLVLDCGKWEEDCYPFARWAWTPRPASYWGQGLCEQLWPAQRSVNMLDKWMSSAMHRAGSFKVFLEAGSKVVKEHVSNEVGAIITYRGTAPQYVVPQAFDPFWVQVREMWLAGMYEQAGISKVTATGEKPAGLDSGEAQRVYRDSVALRMKTQERLNEEGFMELARLSIATARQIAKATGKPYEVRSQKKRSLRKISMTAADLDPKDWRLQCFPTSSLPKDPAGKFAAVQERIQAGLLTMSEGKRLLDFPDLEATESLANAVEDLMTLILDDIVDGEGYRPPEPTMDLRRAKELVLEYINFGGLHNLDPEGMDLLLTWNEQVDALMQMAMAPALPSGPGAPPSGMTAGGGGAPSGVPQGMPMAPPQSNLMPFAA